MMDFFSDDKIIQPRRGDLLISEPYLPDPNFERTVVLLCEHDENGSFGYILNRKTGLRLPDIIEELDSFEAEVFIGGPVQKNSLHFIHRNQAISGTDKPLFDGVYSTSNFEELLFQINTKQVSQKDAKFFIGYSGWSQGQLLHELEHKSWIVYKEADHSLIFDVPAESLWREVLRRMGGKFKMIAEYPDDPRMN